jgi:hypothetical protein
MLCLSMDFAVWVIKLGCLQEGLRKFGHYGCQGISASWVYGALNMTRRQRFGAATRWLALIAPTTFWLDYFLKNV